VKQAEATARRLLFTDRAHGFLEDAPVADGGYRQLVISPGGAWIASLHLENLRIWSFATGHLTPLQAANVSAIAWLPDNRLAMVRSNVKAQSRSSLTVLEMNPDGSGRIAAEFDYDRQLSDATIHPDQDLAVTSEYRNGDYHVVVLQLSDGVVLFETPAPGQTESVAVSDDGARIAGAFRGTPLIRQFDREGRDVGQY